MRAKPIGRGETPLAELARLVLRGSNAPRVGSDRDEALGTARRCEPRPAYNADVSGGAGFLGELTRRSLSNVLTIIDVPSGQLIEDFAGSRAELSRKYDIAFGSDRQDGD